MYDVMLNSNLDVQEVHQGFNYVCLKVQIIDMHVRTYMNHACTYIHECALNSLHVLIHTQNKYFI